jgi:hypothetical protein
MRLPFGGFLATPDRVRIQLQHQPLRGGPQLTEGLGPGGLRQDLIGAGGVLG